MKIENVGDKEIYNIRSILLDDGHFLFRLKNKTTSSTSSYFDVKNKNGITLISLIITIIIMLILAGVVISLTLGENGIFNTAKYAVTKTKEETAREKLELALVDLQARKYTDETYDENEYINNYLSKEGMTVEGNVVLVDGWKFTIDRSVPKVGENLEQGEIKAISITTPYIGTTSFTTKVTNAYDEENIEEYKYVIDGNETTIEDKEYTTPKEQELEPESTHTVKVVAKYKDGTTLESNTLTVKTQPRTYLYNNGDECTDITGGWKAIAVDEGEGTTTKKPTLTYNSDLKCLNAQLYGDSSGSNGGSITINNKIDYSQYKHLNIVYTANLTHYNASNIVDICKNHENVVSWADNVITSLCYSEPINVKKRWKNNVKKINDINSFYIYLQSYYGTTTSINIYEVWLEK